MSRLSVAAETSSVPSAISFGRGRGRGLMGVGRGRGGQKASGGTQGGWASPGLLAECSCRSGIS